MVTAVPENHKDRDVKSRDDIGVGVLNGLQDEQIIERYHQQGKKKKKANRANPNLANKLS